MQEVSILNDCMKTERVYESQIAALGGRAFSAEELGIELCGEIDLGAAKLSPEALPLGLRLEEDLGVVVGDGVVAKRIHGWPNPYPFSEPARVCETPGGDFLLMCPAGICHQWGNRHRVNEIVAYRSKDRGATWQGPTSPWQVDYPQHAGSLFVPKEGKRIVCFGADYHPDYLQLPHAGIIGMRESWNDGYAWSEVRRIVPENAPHLRGVGHMQPCQTESGAWLLGTYTIPEPVEGQRTDRQFVLRSVDGGETWTAYSNADNSGLAWNAKGSTMEGVPIDLGGGRIDLYLRTDEGRIWRSRSLDDGVTWSAPEPTSLKHPDAPPMVFKLPDGKLLALTHNRGVVVEPGVANRNRHALWGLVSQDLGETWSEPRLVAANAALDGGDRVLREVSYASLLVDGETLHVFLDRSKRQILQLSFTLEELQRMPREEELRRGIANGQSKE